MYDRDTVADAAGGMHAAHVAGLKAAMERAKNSETFYRRANPFEYHDNIGPYEAFKIILGVFVTVPLRVFLGIPILFVLTSVCILAGLGHKGGNNVPLSSPRRAVLWIALYLLRLFNFIFFGIYWIRYKGKISRKEDAPICIIAPHSAVMDAFLSPIACNLPSAVGKKEVSKIPLVGRMVLTMQSILVDRADKDAKKATFEAIKKRVSDTRFPRLVIFPEGTCTNHKSLINFKTGAFSAGVPVQPIIFRYPFWNFDPAWTAGSNRNYLVFRLLCQFQNFVTIEYLPVYNPSQEEIDNPTLYANNVREVMAKAYGATVTEHSYEDMYFATAARKAGMNPGLVMPYEMVKLKELFNISLSDAKSLLRKFQQGNPRLVDNEFSINLDDFARILGIPASEPVVEIFNLIDTSGNGRINFPQFAIGMSYLSKNTDPEETTKLLFTTMDKDGSGRVALKTLSKVLVNIFKKPNPKMLKSLLHECDPKNTGFVTCEHLTKVLVKHPDYLHIAIHVTSLDTQGLEALNKNEVNEEVLNIKQTDQRTREVGSQINLTPGAGQRSSLANPQVVEMELNP